MKKIVVSKRTWRTLRKMKNQQGLSNFSKTIDYLINVIPRLPQESLQEIHRRVDELIKAKNLEEKPQSINPDVIRFICLQCGQPFEFSREPQDKVEAIQCSYCGFHHSIQIWSWLEDMDECNENEIT